MRRCINSSHAIVACENCESGCIWSGTNNLAECNGDCEKGYMRNDNSFKCERNNSFSNEIVLHVTL